MRGCMDGGENKTYNTKASSIQKDIYGGWGNVGGATIHDYFEVVHCPFGTACLFELEWSIHCNCLVNKSGTSVQSCTKSPALHLIGTLFANLNESLGLTESGQTEVLKSRMNNGKYKGIWCCCCWSTDDGCWIENEFCFGGEAALRVRDKVIVQKVNESFRKGHAH